MDGRACGRCTGQCFRRGVRQLAEWLRLAPDREAAKNAEREARKAQTVVTSLEVPQVGESAPLGASLSVCRQRTRPPAVCHSCCAAVRRRAT
jgi:hypothetical protein